MDKALSEVRKQLRGARVLHAGCGDLTELPRYRAAHVKSVIWVDARPMAVRGSSLLHPAEHIYQACLADKTGTVVKFFETLDGDHSSMMEPPHDWPLFGHRFLRTVTLADMLAQHNLSGQFHVLVIELQGAELMFLRTYPEQLWPHVRAVVVRTAATKETAYPGGGHLDVVVEVMDMLGFSLTQSISCPGDAKFVLAVFVSA